MSTRTITLTEEQEQFVLETIQSGQFPAGCPPFDKLGYRPIMKQACEAFRIQQK